MSHTDLPINRKCIMDGCETIIQASASFLRALCQDNEYTTCPKGHRQPFFAFASPQAQIAWLERRYFQLHERVNEAWGRRKADLTCPFHRHGMVLRDAAHVIRHSLRKHRHAAEALAEDR